MVWLPQPLLPAPGSPIPSCASRLFVQRRQAACQDSLLLGNENVRVNWYSSAEICWRVLTTGSPAPSCTVCGAAGSTPDDEEAMAKYVYIGGAAIWVLSAEAGT